MFGTQSGYCVFVPMCGSTGWSSVKWPILFQSR